MQPNRVFVVIEWYVFVGQVELHKNAFGSNAVGTADDWIDEYVTLGDPVWWLQHPLRLLLFVWGALVHERHASELIRELILNLSKLSLSKTPNVYLAMYAINSCMIRGICLTRSRCNLELISFTKCKTWLNTVGTAHSPWFCTAETPRDHQVFL